MYTEIFLVVLYNYDKIVVCSILYIIILVWHIWAVKWWFVRTNFVDFSFFGYCSNTCYIIVSFFFLRAYEEVPWDNMARPRQWSHPTTLEEKPDMISQVFTKKRYEPAAKEWQVSLCEWIDQTQMGKGFNFCSNVVWSRDQDSLVRLKIYKWISLTISRNWLWLHILFGNSVDLYKYMRVTISFHCIFAEYWSFMGLVPDEEGSL